MKKVIILSCLLHFCFSYSQVADSIQDKNLEGIIVIGKKGLDYRKESKPLSTLDEYMENSGRINLIQRGNYAWEPTLNNMASERISVTIDGMKIFSACTDKMDPVTSYVEISNLKKLQVYSGLENGVHGSNSIGGGINLALNKTGFSSKKWKSSLNTGYESNGDYRTNGLDISYSRPKFYTNMGVFHRKSENYQAGDHEEVYFSQFEKFNSYANIGYQFPQSGVIEGSLIYDDASDVGYPALTMDVKTARAWITSLSYKKENLSDIFSLWETKFYYNSIVHKMDDTKRPDVPIHMDMPGKSKTRGFYSLLKGNTSRHSFTANWDGYYNQSEAEMTMYPENPNEKPMFMYTWPDIRTYNTGIFIEDMYRINEKNSFHFSSRAGFQHEIIQSNFGLRSIRIFFPETNKSRNRFLFKATAHYQYTKNDLTLTAGGGYGERTPSASEAYGFYLFNSFDNYDYIGNPSLKNEKSLEGNMSLNWKKKKVELNLEASCFHFFDYITGKPDISLSPMTLGAQGAKIYIPLPRAFIFTTRMQLKYRFLNLFEWTNQVSYNLGRDNHDKPLPLIAPVMYSSTLFFHKSKFNSEIQIKGAGKQNEFNSEFGEDKTPGYLVCNISFGYSLSFDKHTLTLKSGMENIFDRRYSVYSDWNNILRKGRNYFIAVLVNL
ncbi:MAG: TonB-dependent receptor [Flavobacteriaceae bacterium]|jgi:iron complex outermembrane receptor protein|nr:TonB-dependent receptor [Flavobacteriaceae bacterium]